MQVMYVDCRIAMYGNSGEDAARVLAVVDMQNDKVSISSILPYRPPKNPYQGKTAEQIEMIKKIEKSSVIVVDNPDAFSNWDLCFSEREHLDEAVKAFYSLDSMKVLELKKEVAERYNPRTVIEVRKMDLGGNVYELNSEEINNGYMAVLLTCWAAMRMRNTASMTQQSDPTAEDEDDFFVPFSV